MIFYMNKHWLAILIETLPASLSTNSHGSPLFNGPAFCSKGLLRTFAHICLCAIVG